VDTVTDGDGNTLEYERKGDYLTVFGGEGKNICITYHGGLSNCYSNRQAMFLPGWFAYYPIPGYHTIIEEYQYIENWQEEKVEYDITVDTDVSVFSNLPRVEENHFRGNTKGATLISGFVAEAELDNGIRCIYPYLDRWDDPVKDVEDTSININQSEDRQRVLDILEKNWTEDSEKVIIIYPVNLMNADITWTEDTLMGKLSWHDLYSRYQENHTFLDVAEPTDPVETIQWVYDVSLTDEENPMTYDELREFWDRVNRENGVSNTTDEEFEEAVRENLGEEAYRQIMSTKGQDEGGEE
jgi:hypothetical protein